MGKCEKRAWPLTLGLLVNAVALVIHGLIENLPEGLFILMELAAIVLMLWGIVETRRRPVCDRLKSLRIAVNRGCHWINLNADS